MKQQLKTQLKKKKRGFTLIEVIVVIGILAILAALAIPAVAGYLDSARERTNISNAKMIFNAANAFIAANPDLSETELDTAIEEDPMTTDNDLISDNYLQGLPLTARNNEYGIDVTSNVVTVTWPAADGGSGTYPET